MNGRLGVWATTDAMPAATAVAFARRVEELGYATLWLPETMGRDPFAHIAHLAGTATRLRFATGIANIHHRHPGAMTQAANTLGEQTGGRFTLGLGVSHAPLVEGLRGLEYGKPVATMRRYLEAMASSPYMSPSPAEPVPRVIGALGPRMTELAGELADGVHPYWTTPEHTAQARGILGEGKLICVEQKVVLTDDPTVARDTARQALSLYADLPNYRNNWLRLGFSDAAIDARADDFVDALVAWGDPARIVAHLRRHLDAGADHVAIQPLTPGAAFHPHEDALAALATEAAAAGLLDPGAPV
ncbi:MAG TPA: TIGR03620 family F420-dependent LLM class oxidoreductase [Acidimicrobiales bacterium]